MARFSIYSKDGQTIRFSGKPKYNGTYMKVSYLEFSEVASPIPIDWEIGDYVYYPRTGLYYRLYSLPQPKKQARRQEYGASFTYSNVQLHDATKELEIALFNDLVLDVERNVHFSTRESVSTYEDVYGIARRIQASMDAFFPNKWTIQVMSLDATDADDAALLAILTEAKEFTANSSSCLGALNAIYNTWEGIGWIHTYDAVNDKDVITIGRPNKRDASNTSSLFVYGLDAGITAIKKSYTNTNEFATRLYVYGSERNLPNRYYNGLEICNADSVDIANLMLPLANWGTATDPVSGEVRPDASLCYIENAAKVAKYGLIPRKVYFNGSQNEEIYPSIKNITAGRLRTAKAARSDTSYVPSTTIYPNAERLDVVKSCVNPNDDGITVDDGDVVYDSTQAITLPSATGYIGASENDRDNRPETYRTPVLRTILDYSPTQSGTRLIIEPDLTISFNTSSVGYDTPQFKQRIILTVQLADGSTTTMQEETELEPSSRSSSQPNYTVSLKNEYCIAAGKITRVQIILVCDRTYNYDTGLSYSFYATTGEIYVGFKEDITETFRMYIKQIGFNLSDCVTNTNGGIATISMKDGMCGGRNFVVKRCTYRQATDDWELTVKRVQDSSVNMLYPNSVYPIAAGDAFVILDIEMPELYVLIAQETLLEYGQDLYDDVSNGKAYYEPEINAKQVLSSGAVLKEGMYMQIHDEDVVEGITDYILIDSLVIDEAAENIPTFKVTLREKKKSSYAEATATALSNLAHQIEINNGSGSGVDIIMSRDTRPAADDNVYSALRSQLEFLSKKYDDVARGLITFLRGATFGQFAEGITGFGGKIDGSGHGELASLTLRQWLEVPELRYNRIDILVGNQWRAPGGGIIDRVEPDFDDDGNMLNTGVIYLHLEDGEIGQVALDDICMGIFHDGVWSNNNSVADTDDSIGNFHFSGFFTCYFRVTEILAQDNHCFRYAIRPVSTNWPETHHPCEAMHFVAYGNFSNTDRQTARYSTRTYERYLKDVNTWEFSATNIGAQFGDLSNLNIFGLNMTGYSAYLNNIYMSGVIEQFELLPYRMEIDTDGQDTLAYGEQLTVRCSVWKGWDDVTANVVSWQIVRDSGDALADAAWNLSSKAVNFRGTIIIEHNASNSDLATIGVSTLFTITATLSDGDSADYELTI